MRTCWTGLGGTERAEGARSAYTRGGAFDLDGRAESSQSDQGNPTVPAEHLTNHVVPDRMTSTSRASSPLTSFSASSSPSATTPKRARSASLSSSSPGPGDSDDDLSEGGRAHKKRSANAYGFDPATLPTTQCQWGACTLEFYELEPLIEHIHAGAPSSRGLGLG